MARDSEAERNVAQNRKARHRFVILESLECGIMLVGTEVKALRAGHASIGEAYGLIRRGELFLMGASISEYSHGNINNHATARERKLLVHRREIDAWEIKVRDKGITVVPLRVYFKGHLVKVEMALVRGKKLHDKREHDKERSAKREIDRAMSRRR